MKKQLLLILMILLPIVTMADESGTCGENLKWTLSGSTGTLVIEGSGNMTNYDAPMKSPWFYSDLVKEVIIKEGVTSVGNRAFLGCSNLKSISLPNSITSIGQICFHSCTSLTSINIPNGVTYIGTKCFYGCTGLTSIIIPNSVKNIGSDCFFDCTGLTSINIPNGVTFLNCFSGCTGLTSINIPNSVKRIYDYCFYGCTGLTSINIPNSVTEIGTYCFRGCTNLKEIILPDSLEVIGGGAFEDCTELRSLTIPKSVTSIYSYNAGWSNPYYVEGHSIATGCKKLESIIVDKGNQIYDSRNNCNAIIETATNTLIVGCGKSSIPEGITAINVEAFQGCESLESIQIPSSFQMVDYYLGMCFSDCVNLRSITVDKNNPLLDSRDNCNAVIVSSTNKLILGCKETIIPNSVTIIGSYSFYHRNKLLPVTSLVVNENLETIESLSFTSHMLENVFAKNPQIVINDQSFSNATYQHAILYVPANQRWDFVYGSGGWYRFNNIREIAMDVNDISVSKAYTLMNAQTFDYSVYDAVNNKVKTIKDFHNIDESVAYNSWQIVEGDNQKYLYNIGARKYARMDVSGEWVMTNKPAPLSFKSDKDGKITVNGQNSQWFFVLNEQVSVNNDVLAIEAISNHMEKTKNRHYTLDGKRGDSCKKGLVLIVTNDGTRKKVVMK